MENETWVDTRGAEFAGAELAKLTSIPSVVCVPLEDRRWDAAEVFHKQLKCSTTSGRFTRSMFRLDEWGSLFDLVQPFIPGAM